MKFVISFHRSRDNILNLLLSIQSIVFNSSRNNNNKIIMVIKKCAKFELYKLVHYIDYLQFIRIINYGKLLILELCFWGWFF